MSKVVSKKKNDKRDTLVSLIFLSVTILFAVFVLIYNSGLLKQKIKGNVKVDIETGREITGMKEFSADELIPKETIDIPGFDVVTFKHGTIQQDSYFYNPAENKCYFKLTLALDDGTIIWQSDYLEPGVAYSHIELNQKLRKGTYHNASLLYDTYSLDNYSRLNGSNINLVVDVK